MDAHERAEQIGRELYGGLGISGRVVGEILERHIRAAKQHATAAERERCAGIVRNYRGDIHSYRVQKAILEEILQSPESDGAE